MARWILRRIWRLTLLVLLLAVHLAPFVLALRVLLGFGFFTSVIAGGIGEKLNARVQLSDSVVTFFGTSRIMGLRAYEADQDEPFIVAEKATTDLNALRFIRRVPLSRVDLHGVRVRLRFDKGGKLLTAFPAKKSDSPRVPAFVVHDGSLTIEQEGRRPFTLQRVSVSLQPGEQTVLVGKVEDERWPLELNGTLEPRTMATSLSLRGSLQLDERVREFPFIPPAVWDRVAVTGKNVPLQLDLTLGEKIPKVRYGVTFGAMQFALKKAPPRPDVPFHLAVTQGKVVGSEVGLRVEASVDDPAWSQWNAEVRFDAPCDDIHVALSAPRVRVNQELLSRLPYVPPGVWQNVAVNQGETSAKVTVRVNTKRPDFNYRVDLNVAAADLVVPSLDLPIRGASGQVTIQDGQVSLREVRAGTAGGQIAGFSDMDFRKTTTLRFGVRADGIALRQVPEKFGLPKLMLDGKVSGSADLTFVLGDRVKTSGTGLARIEQARVLGIPTTGPVEVELRGDGNKLHIEPRGPLKKLMNVVSIPVRQTTKIDRRWREVGRITPMVADGVSRISAACSQQLTWLGAKAPATVEPTYLAVSLALDDVNIDDLADKFGLCELAGLVGKMSVRLLLEVPVNTPTDYRAYRATGEASLDRLCVASREFQNICADFDYRDGILVVDRLAGTAGGGKFEGKARAVVIPLGDLQASLDLRAFPVRAITGEVERFEGKLTACLAATAPLSRLSDLTAWRVTAGIRETALRIDDISISDLHAELELNRGQLSASAVRAGVLGASLTASGSIGLEGCVPIDVTWRLSGLDLSKLRTTLTGFMDVGIAGLIGMNGRVVGSLSPLALSGGGRLLANDVFAFGVRADGLSLAFTFKDDTLSLSDIDARLLGGQVRGNASVTLGGPLATQVALSADFDAKQVASMFQSPVLPEGRINGELTGTVRRDDGRWMGEAKAATKSLRVRGIKVDSLNAEMSYDGAKLKYSAAGRILGGEVRLAGSYPPRSDGTADGEFRLDRLDLRLTGAMLTQIDDFRCLDGTVWLVVPYQHSTTGMLPRGQGRFELRDVRLDDRELTDSLVGDLRLNEDGIVLRDVTSSFCGGQLRAQGGLRYRDPSRNWFSLSLTGAEGSRLTPVGPRGREILSGPIDVQLRGSYGAELSASGQVVLTRGKAVGIEVSEWRVPVDLRFDPMQSRFSATVRESRASIGNGGAILDGRVRWAGRWSVEANLRFFDAGLRSLAGVIGDVSNYASGRLTGRVDISGTDMASFEDLAATIQAKMTDAQALQLPVLYLLAPYLIPGQNAITFQTGELAGRLSRGVLRLNRLTLESPLLLVMMEGTVTPAQGRLDLNVMARSSPLGSVTPLGLQVLARQVPLAGPMPSTIIVRAAELLSERTIYLHVTGTAKTPVVQLEPLRTLSDEAVRFFLGRALAPAIPQ